MRLVSWNVNSVRERLGLLRRVVRKYAPDVVCLNWGVQVPAIRVADDLFPRDAFARMGFPHLAIAGQKGYHGVAIASRLPFERSWTRRIAANPDKRHCAVQIAGIEIHDVYVPAGGPIPDPARNPGFARKLAFLRALGRSSARWPDRATKPRILVGDLNVAPLEHDVWDHRAMRRTITHTDLERELLLSVQGALPWIDVARRFVPEPEKLFTWWSHRAREDWRRVNKGRRLDHAWASPALAERLRGFRVATEVRGWKRPSDHAPLIVDVEG